MADELLDIVNEHDEVIGQKYRSEVYQLKLNNFRVINAFLINDQKEVWIPRRTAHKELSPLALDASVGGHVAAGEEYDQAFERELQEELNLDASQLQYKFLTKLTPHQHTVSAYMHVYIFYTNVDPNFNPDDFISAAWYSIPTLQEIIKQGEKIKSDLPILIDQLQKLF